MNGKGIAIAGIWIAVAITSFSPVAATAITAMTGAAVAATFVVALFL